MLCENGTPAVRLQLTGQDDTPAWRAIYNEHAAKDDFPAEIDGPHGAPVLLVYLTDTSSDAVFPAPSTGPALNTLTRRTTAIS